MEHWDGPKWGKRIYHAALWNRVCVKAHFESMRYFQDTGMGSGMGEMWFGSKNTKGSQNQIVPYIHANRHFLQPLPTCQPISAAKPVVVHSHFGTNRQIQPRPSCPLQFVQLLAQRGHFSFSGREPLFLIVFLALN